MLTVRTGSRLHFGMFSFGQADVRQFGGVGCLIDRPGTELQLDFARQWEATGPLSARALQVAHDWYGRHSHLPARPCRLVVRRAAGEHHGLGTGSQLSLAVAAALHRLHHPLSDLPSAELLARSAGRGSRSMIGTYGFLQGGLLVEAGKLPGEATSPLVLRQVLPSSWRFVLLRPTAEVGLHAQAERQAFATLPPVPTDLTGAMCREVLLELVPAARAAAFEPFAASLFRLGELAGACFAAVQGGIYASPRVAELVRWLGEQGYAGVGQSSWGPTLFVPLPDETAARRLVALVQSSHVTADVECTIAAPRNTGAELVGEAECTVQPLPHETSDADPAQPIVSRKGCD